MAKDRFNKVLNGTDVLVTAFGAMIGWGWVVSSGGWIQNAGVLGTVLGFLIGGAMIYCVGLTYAELTGAMPKCGGEHVFSYKAFGPVGSFVCTWALVLSYIGVVCFEACALPTVIQYIFPGFMKVYLYTVAGFDIYATWLAAAVVFALLITYINGRGVKTAAAVQTVLTVVIALAGILLIAGAAVTGSVENVAQQEFVGDTGTDILKNIMSVAVVAPFFLLGFDVIPQVAEEIKVPMKKVGSLLILSIVMAVAFYSLVVLAIGLVMTGADIETSAGGAGLAAADAMAAAFRSDVMAKVLIIGGMCGIITSWNSFMIGGSRALYSMAEAYMIPHGFAKLHPIHKTPTYAVLLVGGLSVAAPFFGRQMLVWISNASSFACCLAYCMVSVSFLVIRKKDPEMPRPFRIKHYKLVGILAVLMSGFLLLMYLLPGSGNTLTLQEWIIVGGWMVLGVLFGVFCKLKYKEKFGKVVI